MLSPASMSSPSIPASNSPMLARGSTNQLQRSLSWRHDAGLPPTPAEIDQYGDLHYALMPSQSHAPSAYDLRFGDGNAAEEGPPMNAVSKHPKLKLRILLSNNQYEAGESISGALEVTSSTSQRLRLGEIAVELEAFEELTSRDHSATQIFLFNRTLFQGEHLPPSNAVLPAAPIHGHWTARKGRTTFPFSFRLPVSAPSSVTFAGSANLRYAIKGSAQTWWNDTKSVVTVRSDAFVVEKWQDEFDPRYLEPVEAVADTHIFMGGSGAVWLEAGVSEQLFTSGGRATIRAGVKNNSKRSISGIKVAIARRLIIPASGPNGVPAQRQSLEPQITEVIHTQVFKGAQFEFPPGAEVVTSLPVEIPREARTIRKTRLFEVQIVAQISAQMGSFAKDLTVEIPMYVAHPSSLRKSLPSGVNEPLRGLPQRSRSAMSQHGHHQVQPQFRASPMPFVPQIVSHNASRQSPVLYAHPFHPSPFTSQDPLMLPVEAYSAERGWSPAPSFSFPNMGPPSRPTSAAPHLESRQSPAPYPWHLNGHEEGAHQTFQAQSLHWEADFNAYQQQTRPLSAMELTCNQITTPGRQQSTSPTNAFTLAAGSTKALQEPITRPSDPSSVPHLHTETQQSSSMPTVATKLQSAPSSASQPSAITMSQLLSLGAVPLAGLTTIEEDSESATGTVRSVRTLVGTVKRDDIALFEALASQQEEEQRHPTEPVAKSTSKEKRPRASDLFEVAAGDKRSEAPSPMQTISLNTTPVTPTFAQGNGLSALESRLGSTHKSNNVLDLANVNKNSRRKASAEPSSKSTGKGALRQAANAAAERDRKAREEADLVLKQNLEQLGGQGKRWLDKAKVGQNREVEKLSVTTPPAIPSEPTQGGAEKQQSLLGNSSGERKAVNIDEQKLLNKEAVGRVAGWLSSSPSCEAGGLQKEDKDPALSPSTPSPSVLKQVEDADKQEGQRPVSSILQGVNDGRDSGDVVPALSADLRALIDNSNVRPAPKQGTAIQSHIGSRRFSGEVPTRDGDKSKTPSGGQSRRDVPNAASRGIPPKRTEMAALKSDASAPDEGEAKYDVRSARGGRGGRVASVANMWASIADGTDGSQIRSDDTPVLTLRPKALRSGAAEFFKLDFSKKPAAEESKKPRARDIFSTPPSVELDASAAEKTSRAASDRPLNLPSKTNKAAHFVNTTMPKPVFVKATSPSSPLSPVTPVTPVAVRKLSPEKEETQSSPGKLSESRRIVSDRLAKEGKLKTGRDLCADKIEAAILPMNGRGTTKAIGRDKLADLRNLWGG